MKICYNSILKERAKDLKKHATFAERYLCKYLKGCQIHGYQFTLQKPINEYIVDFYCAELRIVIEMDGITHNGKQDYDNSREQKLKSLGLDVIRFDGYCVLRNITGVIEMITERIIEPELKTTP